MQREVTKGLQTDLSCMQTLGMREFPGGTSQIRGTFAGGWGGP